MIHTLEEAEFACWYRWLIQTYRLSPERSGELLCRIQRRLQEPRAASPPSRASPPKPVGDQ